MADFIALEDAARLLNISLDELKEMRSRGEIFGVRDGTSWKFKSEEIERVRSELAGDILDDDPGGSSILISERSVGSTGSKVGSTLSGGSNDSDLRLEDDDNDDSEELHLADDLELVADPSSSSGVKLVNRNVPAPADDDDEILSLADEDDASGDSLLISDLNLEGLSDHGAASTPGSGISLDESRNGNNDSNVLAGISGSASNSPSDAADLIQGDSSLELVRSGDDDDIAADSDIGFSLQEESGINLNVPSESGISLEQEPLELNASGISGLDFGSNEFGGDVNAGKSAASGSLSGVNFAGGEDFQLGAGDAFEIEEDSGSQEINLEDSVEVQDGFGIDDGAAGFDDEPGVVGFGDTEQPVGTYAASIPDVQFEGWQVGLLLCSILVLALAGIVLTDISRNMWSASEGSSLNLNSWLSEAMRPIVSTK